MKVPCYIPIRKCKSFWTWLFWNGNRRFPEIRIFGWDFYGWHNYPHARRWGAK